MTRGAGYDTVMTRGWHRGDAGMTRGMIAPLTASHAQHASCPFTTPHLSSHKSPAHPVRIPQTLHCEESRVQSGVPISLSATNASQAGRRANEKGEASREESQRARPGQARRDESQMTIRHAI